MGLVRLYGTLRPRAGEEGGLEVPWRSGDTVAEVIQALVHGRPGLKDALLDEGGQLLPFVSVFLNGRDVRHLQGLETRLDGDSELVIFPPVAGGQTPAPGRGPVGARLGG